MRTTDLGMGWCVTVRHAMHLHVWHSTVRGLARGLHLLQPVRRVYVMACGGGRHVGPRSTHAWPLRASAGSRRRLASRSASRSAILHGGRGLEEEVVTATATTPPTVHGATPTGCTLSRWGAHRRAEPKENSHLILVATRGCRAVKQRPF